MLVKGAYIIYSVSGPEKSNSAVDAISIAIAKPAMN